MTKSCHAWPSFFGCNNSWNQDCDPNCSFCILINLSVLKPFPHPFLHHSFHEVFPKVRTVRPMLEPIENMVNANRSMETSVNCIKLFTSQPKASRVDWLEVREDYQMDLRRKRDKCWRCSLNQLYIEFSNVKTLRIKWYEQAIAGVNRLLYVLFLLKFSERACYRRDLLDCEFELLVKEKS